VVKKGILVAVVVSLLAGVIIDRVSRKAILILADLIRASAVVLLIVADQTNQIALVYGAAVVLAAAGKRTLLIDADFRRPSQHRIFGKVRNLGL